MFSNKLNRVKTTENALQVRSMYNTLQREKMVEYNILLSKIVSVRLKKIRHSFADLYADEIDKRKWDDDYALEYAGALDVIAAIAALNKRSSTSNSYFTIMIKDGEVVSTLTRTLTADKGEISTWDEFIVFDYISADNYRISCDVLFGGKECKDIKDDFLEFCDTLGDQLVIEEMPGLTSSKTTTIPIREFLKYPERYLTNLTLFHEFVESEAQNNG